MINERSTVRLHRLIEAINQLPDDGTRQLVLLKLRECDPWTRYYTLADGRVDAVQV